MLLMISQFIAYFNFSNLPSVLAIALAEMLEAAGIGALPLLIGMIVVVMLLDIIIPGIIPKWAIFAPIFVPLFVQLGVPPQTGLAAYRVADSPLNTITPLMVYLPFMVTIAQRYQKDAGIGTIIALMMPYAVIVRARLDRCCSCLVPARHPARARLSGRALTPADDRRPTAMSDIAIVYLILAAAVVLFVWGRVPVGLVAIGVALALWATGLLTLDAGARRVRRPDGPVHREPVRRLRGPRRDRRHGLGGPAARRPGGEGRRGSCC